jgi:16S rRNA (guanine966-N2)-methyltransferase
MRIIAGEFGSRIIKTPRGSATQPMSERVRQAMFNSLGSLEGLEVWDAFAGSGSLAFEAVSRGAESAVATDRDRKAYDVLKKNAELLKIEDRVDVVKSTAKSWSSNNPDAKFDIIFCDPPYADLQLSTVFSLFKHLKPKGLMLLSQPGSDDVATADGVVVVDNRNYGGASLITYRLK